MWYDRNGPSSFQSGTSYLPEVLYGGNIISPVAGWQVALFDPANFKNDTSALKMYSRVMDVTGDDNPCLLIKKIRNE